MSRASLTTCGLKLPSAEYMRDWRARNPERARAADTRNYDNNRARLRERWRAQLDGLKAAPCADCGIQYPPHVMQFDHLDPDTKSFAIDATAMGRRPEVIAAELAKCDLVCANCHAERTHQQRLAGRRFGGTARIRPRVNREQVP